MGRLFIQHVIDDKLASLECSICKHAYQENVPLLRSSSVLDIECKSIISDYYIINDICTGNITYGTNDKYISIYPNTQNTFVMIDEEFQFTNSIYNDIYCKFCNCFLGWKCKQDKINDFFTNKSFIMKKTLC